VLQKLHPHPHPGSLSRGREGEADFSTFSAQSMVPIGNFRNGVQTCRSLSQRSGVSVCSAKAGSGQDLPFPRWQRRATMQQKRSFPYCWGTFLTGSYQIVPANDNGSQRAILAILDDLIVECGLLTIFINFTFTKAGFLHSFTTNALFCFVGHAHFGMTTS
jgi:hypothetical protein